MTHATEYKKVPTIRLSPSNQRVEADLGLLADLAGTWHGKGFNLIGRPDFQDKTPVYLELNQTEETLKFDLISTSIPNRGFFQEDIELYGLTYLQKISDAVTKGALHIEPGIWVTQPNTKQPPETAAPGSQLISRMASIPHGNAILAQGLAQPFSGPPTLKAGAVPYNGSIFPSFNSTPFPVGAPIFAAGSAEFKSAPAGANGGFPEYTIAPIAGNPPAGTPLTRTPFGNTPAVPLPISIDGVAMQDAINDPISLLQAVITKQISEGFQFEGVVLNVASQASISFTAAANNTPAGPPVAVNVPNLGGGGIENIAFLGGSSANADSALVYSTFWIEKLSHPHHEHSFLQLQYAQMVLLNFPIFGTSPPVPISWPHVSVATLTKVFG
jgi:hypothetical protein